MYYESNFRSTHLVPFNPCWWFKNFSQQLWAGELVQIPTLIGGSGWPIGTDRGHYAVEIWLLVIAFKSLGCRVRATFHGKDFFVMDDVWMNHDTTETAEGKPSNDPKKVHDDISLPSMFRPSWRFPEEGKGPRMWVLPGRAIFSKVFLVYSCWATNSAAVKHSNPDDSVKPTPVVVSHGHIAGILIIQSGKCLKKGGVYESFPDARNQLACPPKFPIPSKWRENDSWQKNMSS